MAAGELQMASAGMGPTIIAAARLPSTLVAIGLKEADVTLFKTDGSKIPTLLQNKSVDACITWEPVWRQDVRKLLERPSAAPSGYPPPLLLLLSNGPGTRTAGTSPPQASISGFGQDGPYAKRPGFDQVVQGMGGLLSITGLPGHGQVRAGIAVADSSAGLYAAIGIFIALLEREVSGEGQWVQCSLLHAQIAMLDFQAARYLNDGEIPVQAGNDHPTSCPVGLDQASDGYINIAVSGEGNWRRFCEALGRPEWLSDPDYADDRQRVAHRDRLNSAVQDILKTRPAAYWVETLNRDGVPAGPVHSVPEMFSDPQVKHVGAACEVASRQGKTMRMVGQPIKLTRTPARVVAAAAEWGEHTDEILREAGYTPVQISDFRNMGVI